MSPTGSTGLSHRHEQLGVRARDFDVVADDRKRLDDVVEERLSRVPARTGGGFDADAELGDRDDCNGGLVVVGDQFVQVQGRSFGVDEDVGVQQEERQNRSSTVRSSRMACISLPQARSTRWRRSRAFAAAPVVPVAGSSWAMTRPRRTIV